MTTAPKVRVADEWMSLQAAADRLGESRLAVLTRIVKGEIEGTHIANRTVVRRATVDALIEQRAEAR